MQYLDSSSAMKSFASFALDLSNRQCAHPSASSYEVCKSNISVSKLLHNSLSNLASDLKSTIQTSTESNLISNVLKRNSKIEVIDLLLRLLESKMSESVVLQDNSSSRIIVWIYILLLVSMLLVGLIGWSAFIKTIRDRIWVCKGILTLIPYKMLMKNKKLRTSLIKDSIIQALQ